MAKHEWQSMDEQTFDAFLQQHLDEAPPEDMVASVTPWRRAMNRILWGCVLNAVTLNFLLLNYILPSIGMVLMLLGFRTLRKENPWFRHCFILTALRCGYFFPFLILNSTIYHASVYQSNWMSLLNTGNFIMIFASFFCLWRALIALRQTSGVAFPTGSAAGVLVWYAAVYALALLQYSGWFFAIGILIAYGCIIHHLFRLSKVLDEAGYAIRTAPVRLSDPWLAALIAGGLALGITLGYCFGNSYSMAWTALPSDGATTQVKEELRALGFPAHILDDLTGEDLLACQGAKQVLVDVNDHPVNDGRQVVERTDNHVSCYTVYDTKELRITGIAVELPGQRERWKIIQHFQWLENPGFYGTESIQLWPAYRLSDGWAADSPVTGQVLYDCGGVTYAAPYASLAEEHYTSNSMFWGTQNHTDVFATFSLPNRGQNHRGYVSYTMKEMQDGWIVDAWINYTHQRSWAQYPAITARDRRKAGGLHGGAFLTVQDALQFNPNAEGVKLFNES